MTKKIILFLKLTVLAGGVFAQTEPPPGALLKMAPQQFATSTLKLGVEHFGRSHARSVTFYLSATANGRNFSSFGQNSIKGLGAELQYRKYLRMLQPATSKRNRTFLLGVYSMAFIQGAAFRQHILNQSYSYDPVTNSYNPFTEHDFRKNIGNWSLGVALGLQRSFWQVFYLDVHVGGGVQSSRTTYEGLLPPYVSTYTEDGFLGREYAGIFPKAGLQLGIKL